MIFYLILAVLGISYLIGFAANRLWEKDSPQWKAFPVFYTFLPAIISILLVYFLKGNWSLGSLSFLMFPPLQMALGLFLPILVIAINPILMSTVFGYKWKGEIVWKKTLLEFPIGVLAVLVFIAGEEIGWRGFLQEPLVKQFGTVVGIIILGIVWGLWHAPIALRGYNLQSNFLAETFVLYPFMCVCFSFPMAFLTIRTGSIWPALLFHAVNNTLGGIAAQFFDQKKTMQDMFVPMVSGAIVYLPFAFFV